MLWSVLTSQKPEESISEYVTQLSEFCGFKDSLENMLRDRLVAVWV